MMGAKNHRTFGIIDHFQNDQSRNLEIFFLPSERIFFAFFTFDKVARSLILKLIRLILKIIKQKSHFMSKKSLIAILGIQSHYSWFLELKVSVIQTVGNLKMVDDF